MSAKPIAQLCAAKLQHFFELSNFFSVKVQSVKCKGKETVLSLEAVSLGEDTVKGAESLKNNL